MTRLLPLLALAALVACGPSGSDGASTGGGGLDGADVEALPDTAMVREVSPESTLDFLRGDLVEASPSIAIQTIDLWIARLDTVSADGAAEVRDDLETLRNQLQSSPIDGVAVGRSLSRLGEGTAALASPATPLERLGQTLRSHGARLAPDSTATDSVEVGDPGEG